MVQGGILPPEKTGWGGGTPYPPPPLVRKGVVRGGKNPDFSDDDSGKSPTGHPRLQWSRHKTGRGVPLPPPPLVQGGLPPPEKNRVGGRYPPPPLPGVSLPGSGATVWNEFRILQNSILMKNI